MQQCARHGRGIGGASPLGTLSEGTPHIGDKGVLVRAGLVEVYCEMRNRTRVKRRKAGDSGVSSLPAAKPDIRRGAFVLATVSHEIPCSYPGRSPGLHAVETVMVVGKDERTEDNGTGEVG